MFIENALSSCFVALSSREPESTSLEKALEKIQTQLGEVSHNTVRDRTVLALTSSSRDRYRKDLWRSSSVG
jgi:hypothetical protein